MKQRCALFLLVCSVLRAKLVDMLAALVGRECEAVDAVDAWFRSSDSRRLRGMSDVSPRDTRPVKEIQPG
jgi:hypothetical protein